MKKANQDSRVYLQDIRQAIDRIEQYTAPDKRAFFDDQKTQDAVIRQLSIMGEAAGKLPAKLRTGYPAIPWKQIIGMRNILIHDYSEISVERVWETVEHDLPGLKKAIEYMIAEEGNTSAKAH